MRNLRPRVALVQRVVPHYNLVFYEKLLASSRFDWEFVYGDHAGSGESGLPTSAQSVLPTRAIRNVQLGKALWQRGVARWIRSQRYSAVVFELGWQIISNPLVVRAAHKVGAVAIPWTKGIAENGRPRPAWRRLLERAFISRCDAVLVYGQVSAEYFLQRAYPPEGIFIAQNTVDVRAILGRVPIAQANVPILRARLGIGSRLVIGYFGRLVPQKRVDQIIGAFADEKKAGLDAVLVIAGEGPARKTLEAQALASGVAASIRFCGRIPEAEADSYFEMYDIFVSAYSAGLAVLEAMTHGKIVVVTPERRPETELIDDGLTGIVTAGFSRTALRDGLRRAALGVCDGAIGQRAQHAVLSQATAEKMVDSFDRAITYALQTRPQP